jgi:hypothetical protein
MALPGESACRPVKACAAGRWGDIERDAGTQHVDGSYAGNDSDGSEQRPWVTVADAIMAAPAGGLVAIAAGSYAENLELFSPVRLYGVCPELVSIVGVADEPTIVLRSNADGAVLNGFGVTGTATAVLVLGAQDFTLDSLWIHESGFRGIEINALEGSSHGSIRNTLVEAAVELGVRVGSSEVDIDGFTVRATQPAGIEFGRGLVLQSDPGAGPSTVALARAVVEQSRDFGVFIYGSNVDIRELAVRETMPRLNDDRFGIGISVQRDTSADLPSTMTATRVLVERSYVGGINVSGSTAELRGVAVRDTLPVVAEPHSGPGIIVRDAGQQMPANATIIGSLVERSTGSGIWVTGSSARVDGVLVQATQLRPSDQLFGRGLQVQSDPVSGGDSTLTLVASRVFDSRDVGVAVVGSTAEISDTVVELTAANGLGQSGDGLYVTSVDRLSRATVTRVRIDDSARAAVSNFGASVTLGGSHLRCQAFDIDGEPDVIYLEYEFIDGGDNACGCPEASERCKAVSAGLTAPVPLP